MAALLMGAWVVIINHQLHKREVQYALAWLKLTVSKCH